MQCSVCTIFTVQTGLFYYNCSLFIMKKAVVIVAGGKGVRMGGSVPKQFMVVAGLPILMRTISVFHDYDVTMQIIVVLPSGTHEDWRNMCREYRFDIPHVVVAGGETRFHSVKNGLDAVSADCDVVGVHDGVRPFVSPEVIDNCYNSAMKFGSIVPVIDVVETVRKIDVNAEGGSVTVDRNLYKLVQTPQVFRHEILDEAYRKPYENAFTDDASVVEACGHSIHLVPGNRENIKITTPYDLIVAEALVASRH